ncbi:hypothetical protein [uncultured Clostridium sp.]|jgi:hypothetical protein|uniref:hypothetical protein n=1 Tax=uncultured Clostridium sp. TaxID=59620 RepID=UPI002637237D|nr:hypothetical protein [uncultured Clostridium sp.]
MKYKLVGNDDSILNARYNSFMGESYGYLVGLLDRKLNSECNKDFRIAINREFSETLKTVTGSYITDKETEKIKLTYELEKEDYKKSGHKMLKYIYTFLSNEYGKDKDFDIRMTVFKMVEMFKNDNLKGYALDHLLLSVKL